MIVQIDSKGMEPAVLEQSAAKKKLRAGSLIKVPAPLECRLRRLHVRKAMEAGRTVAQHIRNGALPGIKLEQIAHIFRLTANAAH